MNYVHQSLTHFLTSFCLISFKIISLCNTKYFVYTFDAFSLTQKFGLRCDLFNFLAYNVKKIALNRKNYGIQNICLDFFLLLFLQQKTVLTLNVFSLHRRFIFVSHCRLFFSVCLFILVVYLFVLLLISLFVTYFAPTDRVF